MAYIERRGDDKCPFCNSAHHGKESSDLTVIRGQHAYVLMNLYPYNGGHLLVLPYRHINEIIEINKAEFAEITKFLQQGVTALKHALNADGFNIGSNIGSIAGAGIPDHIHFHIVPRWEGDTNFMPVVGATKVMPESLEDTKARLIDCWPQAD